MNSTHFAGDIIKCILMNERFFITNKVSLKGPLDNNQALV